MILQHIYVYIISSVFSIVNEEPNAEECKSKIKAYEEVHRTQIVIRQSQRADEERAIQDRIAAEQREAERLKRDLRDEERAIALTKRKLKQESTEVLLGVSYIYTYIYIYIYIAMMVGFGKHAISHLSAIMLFSST
jgi:hypothetical protein